RPARPPSSPPRRSSDLVVPQCPAVQPGQIGTFRRAVADLRQVAREQPGQLPPVTVQIAQYVVEPRLTVTVRGDVRHRAQGARQRSEEHTSELQSRENLV